MDYIGHADFLHAHLLKHGYVERVKDWPYSTFHRYVLDGMLLPVWCGDIDDSLSVND